VTNYCDATVRKAGEDPQSCGLELPCPIHDDPRRPRGLSPMEWTGIYLGELRDV
jgi:hypothetical protein